MMALNLSLVADSDAERNIASTLQAAVNSQIGCAPAAEIINETVINQLKDANAAGAISPAGWRQYLWMCLGKAAEQVPYDHPGAAHLVSLVEALQRLPPRTVSYTAYDGRSEQDEVWEITPESGYGGLEQWLWEVYEGMHSTYLDPLPINLLPSIHLGW